MCRGRLNDMLGAVWEKGGKNMAETYEKEGILYFRKPFQSDLVEWNDTHLGLNTIILKNSKDFGNRIIHVVAVSTDKGYNDALFEVKKFEGGGDINRNTRR